MYQVNILKVTKLYRKNDTEMCRSISATEKKKKKNDKILACVELGRENAHLGCSTSAGAAAGHLRQAVRPQTVGPGDWRL